MSLASSLNSLYARLNSALININEAIVDKGGTEAESIYAIGNKIKNIESHFEVLQKIIEGKITDLVIPNGITSIDKNTFYVKSLYSVVIPKSVSFVQTQAFWRCTFRYLTIEGNEMTMFSDSFYECNYMENVTIGAGWKSNIYLHYSSIITQESLHRMIENLADVNTFESIPNFKVGGANIAKIDEEHLNMLTDKGWNYE